ncbi:OsmC family protein [Catalinimonas niigatensis]|uniref:OsmC family protein n=1 Tax=Catalinimonas niigatensis TaxID=1397264 RepID=UPI002665CE43|nr:OsmC family protein [Catalinimonas niigatensis]WPP49451.1 OsmC family protein [Catalinimonas niigatensis]
MALRKANAEWKGGLKGGNGNLSLGSGAFEGKYSFQSRFEEGTGTNPEELVAAAHAACFSMALSAALEGDGFSPESVKTEAQVSLVKNDGGFSISKIKLITQAKIPDISQEDFDKHAEGAKKNCPISKALSATNIELEAKLV